MDLKKPAVLHRRCPPRNVALSMRGVVFAVVLAAGVFAGADARADGLTVTEVASLERHETVTRQQTIERGDRRYVGGVTYTVIDASPAEVAALLDDAESLRKVLPRTKSAHDVDRKSVV